MHGLPRCPFASGPGGHASGPVWHDSESLRAGLPGACQAGETVDRRGVPGAQLLQRPRDVHRQGLPSGGSSDLPRQRRNPPGECRPFQLAREWPQASAHAPRPGNRGRLAEVSGYRERSARRGRVGPRRPGPAPACRALSGRSECSDRTVASAGARGQPQRAGQRAAHKGRGVGGPSRLARGRAPRTNERVPLFPLPRQDQPHSLARIGLRQPSRQHYLAAAVRSDYDTVLTNATATTTVPENAYKPLPPGASYDPLVPASAALPELTARSVGWGLFLCVIFTVASAYSGLKVGQVMEAAIPISILAIGLARLFPRRSTVLENVIITGIGGVAGGVVAGAIFTLPALYILKLDPHPLQTILICLAGGCLGVLFLIPLRRYFVRETHGLFPFPEATAITEVLVTGEKGGSQAKLLLEATAIAGVYDFLVTTFHVWKEYLDFQFLGVVKLLSTRAKTVFSFDAIGFILGLGYVMGLRSSMILCAGGVLSNFVLVPLIWFVGSHLDSAVYPAVIPISKMTAVQIYRNYVRFVGVGAIATAGIFGIIKSLKVVVGSFGIALRAFRHGEAVQPERTDRDVPMISIFLGVVITAIALALFLGHLPASWTVIAVGVVLTLL